MKFNVDKLKNMSEQDKKVKISVECTFNFPIEYLGDEKGSIDLAMAEYKHPLSDVINEELRRTLFNDSFGRIPANGFTIKKIECGEFDKLVSDLKAKRIQELETELTGLRSETAIFI